ncbi:helix-turn-helix domain-containing protein [Myceligenerans xiligouense]|uniref:AraC family transcriptional regulator n=1 Tax=Myceligenerans xiligouense TaxID=253184 RepID=A0A3N4YMF8_9MICO|nr:helix-turn-helix domain-containing protein [Myceligenerans xiligouense]RPF21853.1 AraC family transcriptional regulator [Myceligenerans xiligouense]
MTGRLTTHVTPSFEAYRAVVAGVFLPLDLSSSAPESFRGVVRAVTVDDVHVSDLHGGRHVVERTPRHAAHDDLASFKLSLMVAGTSLLVQDGREALLRPGDLAVYDTRRPYTLEFDQEFRSLVVMFPQSRIELPAGMVRQLTAVRLGGDTGVGAIVAPFLGHLCDHMEQLERAPGTQLSHSALDLVSTMFATELGHSLRRDPHEELLEHIRAYIEERLGSTDLTPASIAAAHFISTRHLHALFHDTGTTVAAWIRQRRLERCRRDLITPRLADAPVSVLAARWGFVDAAHFSRAFKAEFGMPPREYRAAH